MRSMSFFLCLWQQTKRKLEDAAKRLGYLYDKLREQSVSSPTQHMFYRTADDPGTLHLCNSMHTFPHLGAQ